MRNKFDFEGVDMNSRAITSSRPIKPFNMARWLTQRNVAQSLLPPLAVLFFLAWNTGYGLNSYRSLSTYNEWAQADSSWQNGEVLMSRIAEQPLRPPEVHGDYDRQSYCARRRPCVALLSTTNKAGIQSPIDPRSLKSREGVNYNAESSVNLRRRVLVRNAYCAAYHCDVVSVILWESRPLIQCKSASQLAGYCA